MDGPGHFLSLKVMRVSRPATLRDLTHATELLTLPSAFGAIQLGETFSSCLCVNNEASVDIEAVSLRVEMQTVTSKVPLAELGGWNHTLLVGDTLENVIHHEIKELGQHVLACTVTYRLPPNARHAPGPAEDVSDPTLQTFRKFYKFAVTNPLSVKTKVHAPRSPSALLSAIEREKIFLEVHIQNLTQDPLWFERMDLEPVEGWKVHDENVTGAGLEKQSIFAESTALMQPQDLRQYVYTLVPLAVPSFHVPHAAGSIIPLGRLDISWRSGFGEPGRLLTSMLSRRIPLPPPVQSASAIPPYLQRTNAPGGPPRPGSPQHTPSPSRPGTPPIRPGSPYRARNSASISSRPQSPGAAQAQAQPLAIPAPISELEADLVIRDIPRAEIEIEKPFAVAFTIRLAGSVPPRKRRVVRLAVQTLQSRKVVSAGAETHGPSALPHFGSGLLNPSPTSTPWRGTFTFDKPPVGSPGQDGTDPQRAFEGAGMGLLSPFVAAGYKGVLSTGSSAIFLDEISLSPPAADGDAAARAEGGQDFALSYVPLTHGFSTIGGLRVIVVDDQIVDDLEGGTTPVDGHGGGFFGSGIEVRRPLEASVLREWEIVGEIWVKT
ncbi:DUF974-domain-containing protein [Athelia psychrophila]|uniref:DUF974-domain-containing protein n=1 Tax=Athelia psychrophila TaxID=1759441 RepID=A0A167W6S3_9AGAM|nr:DUF974-domain-containing protein [Fibularhizoctonia sp. CBS 109695]